MKLLNRLKTMENRNQLLKLSILLKEKPKKQEFFLSGKTPEGHYPTLIYLDQEDIQYFANKYLPKLQEEMESKINILRGAYEKNEQYNSDLF